MSQQTSDTSIWVRSLLAIERLGNRLPAPALLFLLLIFIIIIISALCDVFSVQGIHPASKEVLEVNSLLSFAALRWWLENAVKNFMGFAPVGPVIVVMLGLGIAEHSGFLSALLRRMLHWLPANALTFGTVLVGVLSSIAVDAGYVVAIPLSGVIFSLAGRSPLIGIVACFAGVSGGFSANLMVGPVDAILAGISTEAAHLIDADYQVSPVANYYFMIASTFIISLLATWVTSRWVEPALNKMSLDYFDAPTRSEANTKISLQLTVKESKALKISSLALFLFIVIIAGLVVPENAPLRDVANQSIVRSPFMSGLVLLIAIGAAIAGVLYGRLSGVYQGYNQVVEGMEGAMKTLAGYLVLMFFAAQFVSLFSWSNLGAVLAVNGADVLQGLQLPMLLNVVLFVLMAASINLVVGSASAKWAVLAPIFIPMLMLNGISPEVTQTAYRIGDSSTNIITPLMPYFPLVVALMQRYVKNAGVGTLLALMLPYSLAFLVVWSLLLALWVGFGWPLGPA
ncbi:aminobenzoyl-glutamate transporter [Oleispira antarctica]|uniref:Aminobenzoyl-glutamate transporter n=1 Tax=Oleispira antarctica TaxID=188908 RepID=A0A1Y5HCV4_OLEAN|nr:aminobenzoyl-glutamate transporter [Oleispira antarctica]